jgi:hypothetical protein
MEDFAAWDCLISGLISAKITEKETCPNVVISAFT